MQTYLYAHTYYIYIYIYALKQTYTQDARSVIVIIVENGHSNVSSNPERGCFHFIYH